MEQNWKRVEVGGVFLGIVWYTQIAILVHMSMESGSLCWVLCEQIGLLCYACNEEMQLNVETGIVYLWNWLR